MNNVISRPSATEKRLAKKRPKPNPFSEPVSIEIVSLPSGVKSASLSHVALRDHVLQQRPGKTHPSVGRLRPLTVPAHGVELTDDVVILDRQGHRVPRPHYATLRIDQLPQFKKGK